MYDDYELTGLEEHLRDEAFECGDRAAMRSEALREARLEGLMLEAQQHLEDEEEARQNPFGRCVDTSRFESCGDSDPIPF